MSTNIFYNLVFSEDDTKNKKMGEDMQGANPNPGGDRADGPEACYAQCALPPVPFMCNC